MAVVALINNMASQGSIIASPFTAKLITVIPAQAGIQIKHRIFI